VIDVRTRWRCAEESRYDVIVLSASLPIYQQRFERALRRMAACSWSSAPRHCRKRAWCAA